MKNKLLSLLLTMAMLVTLLPIGIGAGSRTVQAAVPATYFIPDITNIRNTALLSTNSATGNTIITRTNVYSTNNSTVTITGAFSHVSTESMKVKIEALNLDNGQWVPDSNRFTNGIVIQDPNASNKFNANNLNLFPGFNKITFSGLQGSVERSDTFYVLYDRVPFVQSLKIISGTTQINFNEGTQVVVPGSTATLQGVVANATRVTVSVNGGTAALASLLEDGTFFSPALALIPGLNTMKIVVTNGSDTINITREVYYFDTNRPFTKVELNRSTTEKHNIMNNIPKVTVGQAVYGAGTPAYESGLLDVQLLVPYNAATTDFAGTATYRLNGSATAVIPIATEIIIPGPDGITPQYKLVSFTTPDRFFFSGVGTEYNKNQTVNLNVTYGTYTTSFNGSFQYLPNETIITDMYYLPGYNGTESIATASKEPLNGAEVDSDTFYILVESDKEPTTALLGAYLPLSTTALTLAHTTGATVQNNKQRVYRVTGFSNGQQKIAFKYTGASIAFNADITYVSKSYIYVANLYDGQTYTFDSRQSNRLIITGEYIGFENIDPNSAQYFINGVTPTSVTAPTSPDIGLDVSLTTPQFSLELTIGDLGPLVYGENRILFTGYTRDGAGNVREIRKELRIYIIDTNVSTITYFFPTLVPTVGSREAFTSGNLTTYSQTQIANIFARTPEFLLTDGSYKTSEKTYDLVLRGSGASTLNLKIGSQLLFSKPIGVQGTNELVTNGIFTGYNADGTQTTYTYDYAGDERDFILRVRDISFAQPGTHVYNLELVNGTGARTNQRLEIEREVSAFRILSPQPTVGNQIIVNKNFVRFDIEAEGATEVLIGKFPATKRVDMNDRFVYDYVGLKADKSNTIKIEIKRAGGTLTQTVNVYYTSAVEVDSQYMEALKNKHTVFNKSLELSFPKGTVLKSSVANSIGVSKFYTGTNLLFGIAEPGTGILEKRNDYGNVININPDERTYGGLSPIIIPDFLVQRYNNSIVTSNFTRISQVFWISGGVGELGDKGSVGYKPATNGLAPYSVEGRFTEYEPERKVVPSNRGTLKLSFNTSVVQDIGYTVTVFRYTDKGAWQNIGGEVDTKNNTISVPFDEFGYYMVGKLKKSFNDVTNHNWARNIMNGVYSKGIMNNIRFDEFGADDQTTRGEFATLLVKGLNIPLNADEKQTFFDVVPGASSSTWDYDHIETAARAGIIAGLSEGFFGPDIRVTREQAAVMIARALELKTSANDSKLEAKLAKSFLDSASIGYYARQAVEAVQKANVMSGATVTIPGAKKPGYNFNPKANMTRAEAARITVALLQKSTSIFPKNMS